MILALIGLLCAANIRGRMRIIKKTDSRVLAQFVIPAKAGRRLVENPNISFLLHNGYPLFPKGCRLCEKSTEVSSPRAEGVP